MGSFLSVNLWFLLRGTESPRGAAEVVPLESAFHIRGQQMCEVGETAVPALFITRVVLAG